MNRPTRTLRFADRARRAVENAGLAPPRAGEVGVVLFDTTPWSAFEAEACGLLDAGERRRAARFRFGHDRCAYVLAHALWRAVLGVCLGRDPGEVPLASLPSGQPRLSGTALATSLSHSGPEVLIAVGRVAMLGVDIERWPPRMPMERLSPVICTSEEASGLREMAPPERERALLQLWTRKEALLKAFGTGLTQAPSDFDAAPGEPVALPSSPDAPPCRVSDLALPGGRVGALATSQEGARHQLYLPDLGVG